MFDIGHRRWNEGSFAPDNGFTATPDAAAWDVLARNVIKGTNGDDDLVGTSADEIFKPLLGHDQVHGGGGDDAMEIDYSGVPVDDAGAGTVHIHEPASGFDGRIATNHDRCKFGEMDSLTIALGGENDLVYVKIDQLRTAATLDIDAGAGEFEYLRLKVSAQGGPVNIHVDEDHIVQAAFATFYNFESLSLTGSGAGDTLSGAGENDFLLGKGGDDVLDGGPGPDQLNGGPGTDTLTGGLGRDNFSFDSPKSTPAGARMDTILDFSQEQLDRINVGSIDADAAASGDQKFTFIGTDAFDPTANHGELRQQANGDGTFTVEGDVNHDGVADFAILVHSSQALVAADFIL